jgi:hypothetical protein
VTFFRNPSKYPKNILRIWQNSKLNFWHISKIRDRFPEFKKKSEINSIHIIFPESEPNFANYRSILQRNPRYIPQNFAKIGAVFLNQNKIRSIFQIRELDRL